jgi:hypothetical protein
MSLPTGLGRTPRARSTLPWGSVLRALQELGAVVVQPCGGPDDTPESGQRSYRQKDQMTKILPTHHHLSLCVLLVCTPYLPCCIVLRKAPGMDYWAVTLPRRN